MKGAAPKYRFSNEVTQEAKRQDRKKWGGKIYNIDTGEVILGPRMEMDEEEDEGMIPEDDNMELYLDQHKNKKGDTRENHVELEDRSKVHFTTVAPTSSPGKDPYRLVINYKHLNASTHVDYHPLPDISFLFTQLGEAKYLSVMDVMKGFWQLPMHPDSRPYTAFITPFGIYQWCVMPMGLHSSPSWWQSCMDRTFAAANLQYFMMYVDDGIIYSTSFEDHVQHLDKILGMARKVGLWMSKKKGKFGYLELKLLGYICGVDGFRMDNSKIERVINWPRPKNRSEYRTFLGGIQYYRRFFAHLSDVTQGFTKLLKKNAKWDWDGEAQRSFDSM